MLQKVKLDARNLKLLYELEKNSRSPISKIAKAVGISKGVAHYRLGKMISSGFIRKFVAIINYYLLGFDLYKLIINLYNINYKVRGEIIESLKKNKNIDLNVYLSSNWDLEINVWVMKPKEFYNFYNAFIEAYAPYIADKNIYIVTKMHLFSHSYLHKKCYAVILGGDEKSHWKAPAKSLNTDETDEALLDALEENPRSEIVALAEKLKTPPATVNHRLKQLVKIGVIRGCMPVLNKSMLGFNTYKVELTLNNPLKRNEVVTYLSMQQQVIKISELIGSKDLDFYVDAQTTSELDSFLEEFRIKCPYIKEFEVINVLTD